MGRRSNERDEGQRRGEPFRWGSKMGVRFFVGLAFSIMIASGMVVEEGGATVGTNEDAKETLKPSRGYNRLMLEKSPYLRQHAENPVDWYPWGSEAFDKARDENKPIFLSIGYSTCHWCHVMAHESFEDPEVARLMNDAFVSIKVDREERPDIDGIYMTVCQMLTGSGGWPLSIFMTPDKKPFFAGTYFPKVSRSGRIGMLDLVPRIKEVWTNRYAEVADSAEKITAALQRASFDSSGGELSESTLKLAYDQLTERFDRERGGFGQAPKFPTSHNFLFLLRYWKRAGQQEALHMVETTLRAMRRGGIFDHIGLGFHRYSTDPNWLLPHFEKMLYDQALEAMAYIETYLATGKDDYRKTAEEIFAYVLRDMRAPDGGFFSGEDADSEGEEGKFYLWSESEIREALSTEEAKLAIRAFGIEVGGNFDEEATGRKTGTNILHLEKDIEEIAADMGMEEANLRDRLEAIRRKLFDLREGRIHPHKDDKILTDWNGLMIAALAKGAQTLDRPEYAEAAADAVDFILSTLRNPGGRLLHRYRDGEAVLLAHLDDYAFLIWGLLELYEATFETRYMKEALRLNEELILHFWDDEVGGFFFTADDGERLLIRQKEIYDGAIPSGNSVAAYNLVRLGRITARPDLEEKAVRIGRAFSRQVSEAPLGYTLLLLAADFSIGPSLEVVIVGDSGAEDTKAMVRAVRGQFVPNKVVVLRPTEDPSPDVVELAPYTEYHSSIDGKATAYVCRNYTCKIPTTDIGEMIELLHGEDPELKGPSP
jgi:uncharacterized protein YyaL (SSP411 family)